MKNTDEKAPLENQLSQKEVSKKSQDVPGSEGRSVPLENAKTFEPKRFSLDDLAQDFHDDPGKFEAALANFGLAIGQIISLLIKNDNGRKNFIRSKVSGFDENGVQLESRDGKIHEYPYARISVIEIFQPGQRIASDELFYPFMGKSKEEFKVFLEKALSGKEMYSEDWKIKGENGEPRVFAGKVSLARDNGVVKSKVIEKAESLKREERVLNVKIDDSMWEQIQSKTGLEVNFDFINDNKERVRVPGKIFVDPLLNKVRYKYTDDAIVEKVVQEEKQSQNVGNKVTLTGETKTKLINIVKVLKDAGYKTAWFDLSSPEKGIIIDKKDTAIVSIVFNDLNNLTDCKLLASLKNETQNGLNQEQYKKTFEPALDIVNNFLSGKIEEVKRDVKQDEKQKVDSSIAAETKVKNDDGLKMKPKL